jgi:hypothetical protein
MSVTKKISTGNYNVTTATSSNVVMTTGTFVLYGNLYVQGNTSIVNVANISTADPTITLNSNVSTPFLGNSGIEIYRGPTNYVPALYWNETVKAWQIVSNIANPSTYSNIATSSSGSGTVGSGTATHIPFYANTGDSVADGGANLTWNGANLLTISGNLSTTNLVINGNYITTAASNSGGSGVYFNNGTQSGELVSNTRALAFSLLLG